ncbi:MAG: hypothetical protein QFX40_03020 [Archaeoglobales archaeon]|nr:hypothetical protein [Archaeoglobales archaeon]
MKREEFRKLKRVLKVENAKDVQRILNTLSALVITEAIDREIAEILLKILELQVRILEIIELEDVEKLEDAKKDFNPHT